MNAFTDPSHFDIFAEHAYKILLGLKSRLAPQYRVGPLIIGLYVVVWHEFLSVVLLLGRGL